MLTKQKIDELLIAPNSVNPLDFVLLCQQAEDAIYLAEEVKRLEAELSEKHTSISDGKVTPTTT